MEKYALIRGTDESGMNIFPLFGRGQSAFEKVAEAHIQPDVRRFIDRFDPRPDCRYLLVNAMGATEYWGPNANADGWPMAGLIHCPPMWTGDPVHDKVLARTWSHGFPTFYNACTFRNHRNKDPKKALGFVDMAAWNSRMKRVELVIHFQESRCRAFDGMYFWDKVDRGENIDVSMGSKVPYDLCTLHTDPKQIAEVIARNFKPGVHKHPGQAVLEVHKALLAKTGVGIPGVAETRRQYCREMLTTPNATLPSGLKIYVDNDYPNFFDISGVFTGADKTAKSMRHLVRRAAWAPGISMEKAAAMSGTPIGTSKVAATRPKAAEIKKEGPPQVGAVTRIATEREPDLPKDVLQLLGKLPLSTALSGLTSAGIILRPREFQRIILIQIGQPSLADELEEDGHVFSRTTDSEACGCCNAPASGLGQLLASMFGGRSLFGPQLQKRHPYLVTISQPPVKVASLSHPMLLKMGHAYNGYRHAVLETLPQLVRSSEVDPILLAWNARREDLLLPESLGYAKHAFYDEMPQACAPATR
jgi:hypothetical protein